MARTSAAVGIPTKQCDNWSDPLPYQAHALQAQERIVILRWGRGAGKTTVLWLMALLIALRYPGIRILVIGPSHKTLTDGLFPVIEDIDTVFKELYGYSLIKKWSRSSAINRLRLLNGSSFVFRTAARIQDLRGGSYGAMLIEEAAYVDASQYSWAAFVPVLRGYGPMTILAGGTPAANEGVLGVLLDLARKEPETCYLSCAATVDNPYFPKEQLALLRATMSKERWQEEILGIPTTPSGLVYPEWDRRIHVIPFDPMVELHRPGWELFEVLDWGFNRAHRLTLAVTQPDESKPPRVVVVRDIPYDRMDADGICRAVIASMNQFPILPRAIVSDPEGFTENRTANRIFAPYGRGVTFEKNLARRRIESTIEFVRRGLMPASGVPSLFVSDQVAALDCNRPGGRGWIPSIEGYRLQEVRAGSGHYKNKPHDDNKTTHVMDCIRMWYINMHKFGYQWPMELESVLVEKRANQWG